MARRRLADALAAFARTGSTRRGLFAAATVIAASSLGFVAPAAASPPGASSPGASTGQDVQALCGAAPEGKARCFALRRTDIAPHKGAAPLVPPAGYGPADLASAYDLPSDGGAGHTVAIVDAFDDPNAEADLAIYRSQFGLPACTTANGCFRKVDQRGGTSYPPPNTGWAGEISLDVDMVSAVAPQAHILLVEADDNSNDNLGAAVVEAVALGAGYVSNSYGSGYDSTPGSGEDPSEVTELDPFYNHPGVAIVASSGDSAFGVSYPAASQYVTSVGGTSLVPDGSARGWSESVWFNASGGPGSGCSLFEAKPSWQVDSGCSMRAVADVSAVADPATGVAVYDTFGSPGWTVFGGTSASSPIIAGVYANAGTPVAGTYPSSYPYEDPGALNDVTAGNNGSCSPSYLCTAGSGYDGPTGLGTPNGVAAFTTGPHGTISGTVTNRRTNAAISGAQITAGTGHATTDASGHYSMSVPVGTYDLTAAAFGYQSRTISGLQVTDGGTTTQNVALKSVPSVDRVGQRHGRLRARLAAVRHAHGGRRPRRPRVHQPVHRPLQRAVAGERDVSAARDGQLPGLPGRRPSRSSSAPLRWCRTSWCRWTWQRARPRATRSHRTGVTQTFDGASTPAGWTVVNNTAAGGWVFNDPHSRGNLTGGSGGFAIIDSDFLGSGNTEDTWLVSPAVDLSGVSSPELSFDSDYRNLNSIAQVDVSVDGGSTWTTVWDHSGSDARGPAHYDVALPGAANQSSVQVRFHYTGTWAWWWEVDNVFLGSRACDPVAGWPGRWQRDRRHHGRRRSTARPSPATTTRRTPRPRWPRRTTRRWVTGSSGCSRR